MTNYYQVMATASTASTWTAPNATQSTTADDYTAALAYVRRSWDAIEHFPGGWQEAFAQAASRRSLTAIRAVDQWIGAMLLLVAKSRVIEPALDHRWMLLTYPESYLAWGFVIPAGSNSFEIRALPARLSPQIELVDAPEYMTATTGMLVDPDFAVRYIWRS